MTGYPSSRKRATAKPKKDRVQGEGNYEAARAFDDAQREFVASGKVPEAARAAAPRSEEEQREMLDAEQESRSRAKEEDPALLRPSPQATTSRTARKDSKGG